MQPVDGIVKCGWPHSAFPFSRPFWKFNCRISQRLLYLKVVRLSALGTGRLCPTRNIPGIHFCQRLSRPQGHSVAGRFMSMKYSSDNIGNQTRENILQRDISTAY
jgi:hypothetical protein